ncbi:MAG: transposase [Acidobacteriota bacterium]
MPRLPRLKPRDRDQSYHLYNRLAGEPDSYPLQQPGAREKFLELLIFYAGIYFCRLAAFALMGNHYHLLAQFLAFRILTRVELRRIAEQLYRDRWFKPYLFWGASEWRRFNRRLFDVSEFMRNLESDYARWHNARFGRKGQLWADRFKSNLLTSARAVQAVALYIELNPLRARLVRRPEQYRFSSARLRLAGVKRPDWLLPLTELWGDVEAARALRLHFACLQHRGGLEIENEDEILRAIIRQDEAEGYRPGVYLENHRYMNDARAMGDEEQIRALREGLVARKVYRQARKPVRAPVGSLALLCGPRRHFIPTSSAGVA